MSGTLGDWSAAILATSPVYENAKRAVESELLAMAVFDVVQRFNLLPHGSTFVGGTALRLCHGSPRLSEDLDLRERAGAARDAIRSGEYRDEMEHFLPSGSPWVLAEEPRRDLVALAFESMVLEHAKLVAQQQTRVVTGPSEMGAT